MDHPAGDFRPCSKISNATQTLNISFARASLLIVFPFALSSSMGWATLLGISIPYLWMVFLSQDFMAKRIMLRFCSVYRTHQAKVASTSMPLAHANSMVSTGWDCVRSASATHDSDPSCHLTKSFQLAVVHLSLLWPLFTVMCSSCFWTVTELSLA